MIQGEVLKDDRGRAKLFPTAEKALAAGIEEVKSRLQIPPKAYAVGLPYGSKQKEFDAYVKLLQQQGITTMKAPGWWIHSVASGCMSGMTAARPSSSRTGYVM